MKKILIIEDNGSLFSEIESLLINNGYSIFYAYSYISALDRWQEENGSFDCIILDLQINPLGLSDEENNEYTPLFGMAFLDHIFQEKSLSEISKLRKKIIIFSGFTSELYSRGRINSKWRLDDLTVISKKSTSILDLINKINIICAK